MYEHDATAAMAHGFCGGCGVVRCGPGRWRERGNCSKACIIRTACLWPRKTSPEISGPGKLATGTRCAEGVTAGGGVVAGRGGECCDVTQSHTTQGLTLQHRLLGCDFGERYGVLRGLPGAVWAPRGPVVVEGVPLQRSQESL